MSTATKTISVSGVLKSEACPVWCAHQTDITESQALDAIIAHMERDSLRIDLLCETGPVHWHDVHRCWHAWGNFTIASAGFEVCPLSDAGRTRLLEAWDAHRKSEHYALAKASADIEASVHKSLEANNGLYCSDKRMAAWKLFLAQSKAIDARLEAIYNERA